MTYPGGKNACYQKIINLIPPHRVYIETHAGSAAVGLNKRPAKHNILIDLDPQVTQALSSTIASRGEAAPGYTVINDDAAGWLRTYNFSGDEFIYCDPPYVMSARRQPRQIYRYELTDQDHRGLLSVLKGLPCKIMISGYWSPLYDKLLAGWHVQTFEAVTRGGSLATEYLWMNYPQPTRLHDYRYLGDNFRERERIKRKKQRWLKRLQGMPVLERQAILSAIEDLNEFLQA